MKKLALNFIGKVLIGFSFIFLFPEFVCLINKEPLHPFIIPQIISIVLGYLLYKIQTDNRNFYVKDGFFIVSVSWILVSLIGALPLYFTGCRYIDALFEIISGFTTTGATIFKDVEVLNKSILFWRSFSHFIGGMGVLAFVMAVIPLGTKDKSMHLLKAEMPGPRVEKLVPSIKKTLFYLFFIYFGLTISEFILLMIGGLPFFDALLISFGTAGTGGFSVLNTSIGSYSVFSKIVVAVFMFLFGVNFNIYFLMLFKNFKTALKSEELRTYVGLYLFTVFILAINSLTLFASAGEAVLHAFFNASTFMSSTGFSIGNVNMYPTMCKVWVLFMMVVSSCAGSTCGGFKVARLVLIFKIIKRDIQKMAHPNTVKIITFDGKKVEEELLNSTKSFMFLYIILIMLILFIVGFDNHSFEISLNAVFTTFGNVGLYFEIPNFNIFSDLSKIAMSIGMLLGRLEIYPIIVLLINRRKD